MVRCFCWVCHLHQTDLRWAGAYEVELHLCPCFSHSQEEFLCLCWNPGAAEPGAGPGQCPPLCGYHRRTVVCMLCGVCSPVSRVAFECPSTLPLPRKQTCALSLKKNKAFGSVLCRKTSKRSGDSKRRALWSCVVCSSLEVVGENNSWNPLMPGCWLVFHR